MRHLDARAAQSALRQRSRIAGFGLGLGRVCLPLAQRRRGGERPGAHARPEESAAVHL